MFIKVARNGYNRHGQQFASGQFLVVFSHNKYLWAEEHSKDWREFPPELERKLYACVRHAHLSEFGHFMMGSLSLKGQIITVSGAYGSDGLPHNYEELTPAARQAVVELPTDLIDAFWKGGGHNSAGSEADAMRQWALNLINSKRKANAQ